MSRATIAWGIVVSACASFAIAFVRLGSMPHLDYPMLTLAFTATIATAVMSREHLGRLLSWRAFWATAAFLVWALISSLASGRLFSSLFGNPANGWGWLTAVCVAAIVLAASGMRRTLRENLVAVAPWLVLIESAFATYEWATKIWPAGTMSNPSYLLLVLSVLLPLTAVTPDNAPTWQLRLRQVALAAGIWTVGISGARVGFVLVAVWVAWALWQGQIGKQLPVRSRRIALVAFGVLAIPAGVWTYLSGGVHFGGFLADRGERIWASLSGMLDRPLIGWGPDGFFTGAAPHASTKLLTLAGADFGQFGSDPHNMIAWTAVSLGIVGLALAGWVVFEVARNWSKQHRSGMLDSALVWGVVLYALQTMFAPAAVQTLPLVGLVLGASLAVEKTAMSPVGKKSTSGTTSAPVAGGRALQVTLLACAVVLFAYAGTRITLREGAQNNDPVAVQKAAAFWSDPYLWYQADLAWGWAITRDEVDSSNKPELLAVQRAVELEPSNAVYLTDLARATAIYGAPKAEVRAAFGRVYERFPLSPDARSFYALYLVANDDLEGAWEQLAPVKDIESVNVWNALSGYYEATGDTKLATQYRDKKTARLRAQDW